MNSKDYWAKRSALDMARYMRTSEQTAALMEQTGKAAADYINSLIKGVFTGFEGFGISETEARNILSAGNNRTALQRLRAAASRVTDPKKRQALTDAINSAGAYWYRIDRLEEVSRQITAQCNSLYKTQLSSVRSCLGGIASEAYYRSIFNIQQRTGLGFSFALFPKSQVEQLLLKHWCGASYSQRLWRDTDILADRLKDELLIGLLSGRSGEKTARVIREQFGNNAYCARRLVRTESAYVCNAAALSGYGEAGIDRYIFVATLDQKTSEVCAELDEQSFLRSEAKAGTNLPPMHPFCRSTTIADFGKDTLKSLERRAKDKDGKPVTVPADMTYSEWREKFIEGRGTNQEIDETPKSENKKTLDKSAESGIINIDSDNDLSKYIGKPITETDNLHVREWYYANVHNIPEQIDKSLSFEEQVRQAFDLRNAYKREARAAMSDLKTVAELEKLRPAKSFDELVADKMRRKNMTRDEALMDILKTASKTNENVDDLFGL